MNVDQLKQVLASSIGEVTIDTNASPLAIWVSSEKILEVCDTLYRHPDFYFDSLSCLTGLDNGKEFGTMEVIYNLYSIPFNFHLMLKVVLSRENPEIDSVVSIWRTANWQEREAYDMFGINFKNHPDMRRILMPADWEGHPMRKDYQVQEEYRGITVKSGNVSS